MSSSRPRLLVVSTVPVWPVDNGFSLRAAALLPELAKRWKILLLAPPGATGDVAPGAWGLDACKPLRLDARWSYLPSQYETSGIVRSVRGFSEKWQAAAALLFGGAEYVAFDDPAFPPAVADHMDCMTLIAMRALPRVKGMRSKLGRLRDLVQVARFERSVTRKMKVTLVVGESDARVMRRLATGRGDVRVLTNGVRAQADAGWSAAAAEPIVIFTGVLDYAPNVDAAIHLAHDIWPAVRRLVPNAHLHLVGRRPLPSVLEVTRDASVHVIADVPDMLAELRRAWVAAAPMLSGAGVKNKVLEAWAAGRPVVMTPLAANGLEPTQRLAGLVASEPRELAERIATLLTDREQREALGHESLQVARERYGWPGVAERLSDMLEAISRPVG